MRMWLEYIRYRFRLTEDRNCLELAQVAALRSLRHSPRCRGWRVLPAPDDPSLSVLEIDWDPGDSQTPFRGSEEFLELHAALTEQVRALEEADYRADARLLRQIVGGPEALFRLAEDIVTGVMRDATIGWRFLSADGSRRGRLGLWLLEILGGPDLFSSSFPDAVASQGPLAGELLDLEERERLIEIAERSLPSAAEDPGRCVLGTLRASLPLHPPPRSRGALEAPPRLEAAEVTSPMVMPEEVGDDDDAFDLDGYGESQPTQADDAAISSGTIMRWSRRTAAKALGR
jgi:hemoglobin